MSDISMYVGTSAVLLVCMALIIVILLRRYHRLLQATLLTELSRFLYQDSGPSNVQTAQSSQVKSGDAKRSHSFNRGMCTGCLTRGNYSRIDVDNLSDTSHDDVIMTYNEYGCSSVTV
ncbi:uncharacterized protein LOC124257049 [Haliotis rubra]|uniref:uncharacterized protein LOC124257049 n=1 Tax=Haliotis rubra TaxID=36100 RepID=UPI001EE5F3B1|nr:uncharacterized protein LOC124257049 [Haliotis rubra]